MICEIFTQTVGLVTKVCVRSGLCGCVFQYFYMKLRSTNLGPHVKKTSSLQYLVYEFTITRVVSSEQFLSKDSRWWSLRLRPYFRLFVVKLICGFIRLRWCEVFYNHKHHYSKGSIGCSELGLTLILSTQNGHVL